MLASYGPPAHCVPLPGYCSVHVPAPECPSQTDHQSQLRLCFRALCVGHVWKHHWRRWRWPRQRTERQKSQHSPRNIYQLAVRLTSGSTRPWRHRSPISWVTWPRKCMVTATHMSTVRWNQYLNPGRHPSKGGDEEGDTSEKPPEIRPCTNPCAEHRDPGQPPILVPTWLCW